MPRKQTKGKIKMRPRYQQSLFHRQRRKNKKSNKKNRRTEIKNQLKAKYRKIMTKFKLNQNSW